MTSSFKRTSSVILSLALIFSLAACDSDNNSDEGDKDPTIVGNYTVTSIHNKTNEELPNAVIPTSELVEFEFTEDGVTHTLGIYIEATIKFQASTYQFFSSITTEVDQANAVNKQDTESGSYSLSGTSLTITSSDPESDGPEVFTITQSGDNLTLDSPDLALTAVRN